MIKTEYLWTEKYRPVCIADTILPADIKSTFQQFVDNKEIPNLLLVGSPGVGKTTVAKAMLEEIGADYIVINGSMDGNIDTLRNLIKQYASSVSFTGGRKYVILDEADFINPNSTQPALRNFMEEFSKNCGFILTANYANKIIPALQSRCSVINFNISKKDMVKLASKFFKRVEYILTTEHVEYDPKVIAEVINKHFPDWRRVLNELQRYSAVGKIDAGILQNFTKDHYTDLINLMKEKNFTEVRKWVAENANNDYVQLFNDFYNNCNEYFTPQSIPNVVLILAKYQYQAAFVVNQEINIAAALLEIMADATFV